MRYFVTGTDTNVGKTEVARALVEGLRAAGHADVAVLKPYQSGGGDDARRLGGATVVYRFKAPLAPGVAAAIEGVRPRMDRALRAIPGEGPCVVEGAGGLFVPLDEQHDVIDLLAASGLPAVLVARAGLGTLNHIALSLRALAERDLPVAAVVLSRGSPGRDPSVRWNRPWLERRHPEVRFLGPVPFLVDARARRQAFRDVVAPLVPLHG